MRWGREDFTTLRRAARQRWGVPDELKSEALFRAAKILTDPEADDRLKLAAAKFLQGCDKVDQADDKLDFEKSKLAKGEDGSAADALSDLEQELQGPGDPGPAAG